MTSDTQRQYEVENSCAGKAIKSSMHFFSAEFLSGCKKLSELAQMSEIIQDVIVYNTSCIINAACYIEAKVNEEISIGTLIFSDSDPEGNAWRAIKNIQKKLTAQEKWDLVALRTNGVAWNKELEPFQSIELIISLRNELVHYKGEFMERDKAPNKRISGLMKQLKISSKATWVEDDCSTWISDLLTSKKLSVWVYRAAFNFNNLYYELRHPKT